MHIVVERAHLVKALAHVHRVVERRNTLPISRNVLLSSAGKNVQLRATDLDIEICEHIPADVKTPGSTTVPAYTFYEVVKKIPEDAHITITQDDDSSSSLTLRAKRSRFTFQALPEAHFPKQPSASFSYSFPVSASVLKKMIGYTQFAISTDETRYCLNGIYAHIISTPETCFLRFVGTDGHRLAQAQIPVPASLQEMPGIIIPRKTINEMSRVLSDMDEEVTVDISQEQIRVSGKTIVVTSNLIEGQFPEYDRVIPRENSRKFVLQRETFVNAIDRVATLADVEKGRLVQMLLHKTMTLSSMNPDSGMAQEEVDDLEIESTQEPLELGFNAKYMLDGLSQIQTKEILFECETMRSPVLISPVNDKKQEDSSPETAVSSSEQISALYVLMPVRFRSS